MSDVDEPSIYFPPGGRDYGHNKYTGQRFDPPWASGQWETPGQKRAYIAKLQGTILLRESPGSGQWPKLEELMAERTAKFAAMLRSFEWLAELNRRFGRQAFRDIKLVDAKSVTESLAQWDSLTNDEYDVAYTYLREVEADVAEAARLAYREAAAKGWVPQPMESDV